MGRAKSILIPVVLFIAIGLVFAGCSGDSLPDKKETSISTDDLSSLTNDGTTGNGDVTNEVVEGLLGQAGLAYAAEGAGASALGKANPFSRAFKPFNAIKMPGMNNFMLLMLTYAMTGKHYDPTGMIAKAINADEMFRGTKYRVLGSELDETLPECMYVDGLPGNLEKLIKGEELTPGELESLGEDIAKFLEDFSVTFGFEGTCDMGDGSTASGSMKIMGSIEGSATSIGTTFGFIMNNLTYNYPADGDIPAIDVLSTGSMLFELDSSISAAGFTFDFFWTSDQFETRATSGGETDVFGLDGAMAISAEGDAVATALTVAGAYSGYSEDVPEYVPDICNAEMIIVYDMAMKLGTDTAVNILWGLFVTTTNESATYCDPTSIEYDAVYVFFLSADQYYIVTITLTGETSFMMTVTGSSGQTATISVDTADNTCSVDTGGSSATATECTWLDLYEGDFEDYLELLL